MVLIKAIRALFALGDRLETRLEFYSGAAGDINRAFGGGAG